MDIPSLSAAVLVQRLASGELLSEQVVDALFARTAAVDGEIHGYALSLREQALREAVAADDARRRGESLGPLHGVPITIKENIATEGHDVTMGVRARRDAPAPRDAIVVRALRNAGAIVLGKSNVPQTLLALETTNALFGTTCNPWNLERTPGGSTGGEAALIASGQSPWGVGSDIGGSIRIPAAFCGVCGFKPSGQRWSNVGSATIMPGQEWVKAQVGVLAREMADVTLLCRVLDEAPEQRLDPAVAPCISRDPAGVDVTKLTIGYYVDDGLFTPAKSVQRAVEEAAKTLETRGARVVHMAPDNAREMLAAYFAALSVDGAETLEAQVGREPLIPTLRSLQRLAHLPYAARQVLAFALKQRGEVRLSTLVKSFGRKSVAALWRLNVQRTQFRLHELEEWNRVGIDAIVCPPHVTPAIPHGLSADFALSACYAMRYNVLDFPAGVVPVTRVLESETTREVLVDRLDRRAAQIERGSTGLPLGVQVVSRPFEDHVALAVMTAIEAAARTRPDYPKTPIVVGDSRVRGG